MFASWIKKNLHKGITKLRLKSFETAYAHIALIFIMNTMNSKQYVCDALRISWMSVRSNRMKKKVDVNIMMLMNKRAHIEKVEAVDPVEFNHFNHIRLTDCQSCLSLQC